MRDSNRADFVCFLSYNYKARHIPKMQTLFRALPTALPTSTQLGSFFVSQLSIALRAACLHRHVLTRNTGSGAGCSATATRSIIKDSDRIERIKNEFQKLGGVDTPERNSSLDHVVYTVSLVHESGYTSCI